MKREEWLQLLDNQKYVIFFFLLSFRGFLSFLFAYRSEITKAFEEMSAAQAEDNRIEELQDAFREKLQELSTKISTAAQIGEDNARSFLSGMNDKFAEEQVRAQAFPFFFFFFFFFSSLFFFFF